ncbi:uncharacterized protein [Amphiura filiformis]|uniref:uncharacterized protein n=1 Tax=Amphiura filiformis TaxID=82378 RepID=UPI003B21E3EF
MVISPILLLNMLIAMMAKTYDEVRERAREEWKRQWARIILVMEGAVPREELIYHQSKYSADVPITTWSEEVKATAWKRHKRIRGDAEIGNPVYEENDFNKDNTKQKGCIRMECFANDMTQSTENLIPGTKPLKEEVWAGRGSDLTTEVPISHGSELTTEKPKTIKALIIMKVIDKRHRKRRKKHLKSK